MRMLVFAAALAACNSSAAVPSTPPTITGVTHPATLGEDGSFSIDDAAPTGPYWLRFVDGMQSRKDVYIFTDATEIDLGRDMVGNDGGLARSPDTKLVVEAGGLSPWQDGDDGDILISNLGHWSRMSSSRFVRPRL